MVVLLFLTENNTKNKSFCGIALFFYLKTIFWGKYIAEEIKTKK